ncbi:glycosyltransferase family 2 protein [Rurimicrobium arvi]|uniref:Glycosyltransferase 2-like domain-containing protein n=1 Tax=Rurimicrobium arvi TaxID=2049916 RepID=A0ABP8MIS7_9BACT
MVKISVVIPAFNANATIANAVLSVYNQSYPAWELIVVDDGGNEDILLPDHTGQLHAHIIRHERNKGVSAARNTGWEHASGSFVAFLDSDDCWHPRKLEYLAQWIQGNPDAVLIGHAFDTNKATLLQQDVKPLPLVRSGIFRFLWRNRFQGSSITVRKDAPLRFDESMRFSEDFDLALQVAIHKYPVYYSASQLTVLGRPQLSKGGLSGNRMSMRMGELKAYRKLAKFGWFWAFFTPFLLLFSLLKHLLR